MTNSDRKLILVVDDTPSNIAVISDVLKEQYRTKIATTAEKAFSLATGADRPALILLDVMMPGMDGSRFVKGSKRIPKLERYPSYS